MSNFSKPQHHSYYNMAWFHKYYSLICPDKLSGFHSSDWQYHVLRALKIHPSEKYYARSGQIALVQNYANWHYREFFDVVYERFGNPIQFVRLGSSDDRKCYAGEWSRRSVVGIGWSNIGSLSDYVVGEGIDKKEIQEKLRSVYYSGNADDKVASRKAGELARFYRTDESTVFVIMDGEKLLALADGLGDYFYDSTTPMSHMKPAKWKHVFTPDEKLPEKAEGKMTSCYPLSIEDMYQLAYRKFIADHHISVVKNCFLMPTDGKEILNVGEVRMDILSGLGLANIQIRKIPAAILFQHYVSRKRMDITILNL